MNTIKIILCHVVVLLYTTMISLKVLSAHTIPKSRDFSSFVFKPVPLCKFIFNTLFNSRIVRVNAAVLELSL